MSLHAQLSPEAQARLDAQRRNSTISSIVISVLVIVLLYVLIVWKGIRIARQAPDLFGCYLAVGLTAALGLQICINMGVTMGLLPTKGLTLPFLSYGGTSLVLNMATIGILMNISASGKTARGVG
jgi:cell division protein FtsW